MPRFDRIILHNLNLPKIRYLQCLKRRARVCWLGWGFDYYDLTGREILKEQTRQLKKTGDRNRKKKRSVLEGIRSVRGYLQYGTVQKNQVLEKIDYFAPVIPLDFVLVTNSLPDFKAEFIPWNYGTLEDDLIRGFEGRSVSGSNILVGNSATPPNNHLEAFTLLKDLDLGGRKIVVPLSYGDEKYRGAIVERGRSLFGKAFVPLVEFLPVEEYVGIISSCSVVIMNHLRQQALGNILIMLYLGAAVFLDPENPVYHFLKDREARVFTLGDLPRGMGRPLDPADVHQNREFVKENWSRKRALEKTRRLLERMEGG